MKRVDLATGTGCDGGMGSIDGGGGDYGGGAEAFQDGEGHGHLAEVVEMDAVLGMHAGVLGFIGLVVVRSQDATLDIAHRTLHVDRPGALGFGQSQSFVAHVLEKALLGAVRGFGGDSRRADVDTNAALLASIDQLADRGEVFLFVAFIRFEAPADVVDAVSDGEDGCARVEDGALQAVERGFDGFAALAGIDEADLAFGKAQQGVGFDHFAVVAGGGNAVAEEDDGIAVAESKVRAAADGEAKEGKEGAAHSNR